jgi:hypothetical protein
MLNVHEVIDQVRKARTKDKKVELLKKHETWALKDILRGTFDSTVEWNLPGGEPPYTPNDNHSAPANLIKEHKKFVYFVKGLRESNRLTPVKRESIFLGLIEGIDPEDAKLVINMINKEKPNGITRPVIEEAFPGLLQD